MKQLYEEVMVNGVPCYETVSGRMLPVDYVEFCIASNERTKLGIKVLDAQIARLAKIKSDYEQTHK
jgi:hypothetical protein